jgi:predicted secreted Zn-dependent protease
MAALRLPAQEAFSSSVSTNFYAVSGNSIREILASIARSKPPAVSMHARTEWKLEWRFTTESGASGCACTEFHIQLATTKTLPRWIPTAEAPAPVRDAWARYALALAVHEEGHAQVARDAAAELRRRVDAVGSFPSCAALTAELNRIGNEVVTEYRAKDVDYDARTRHGATQGAFLGEFRGGPPPPR